MTHYRNYYAYSVVTTVCQLVKNVNVGTPWFALQALPWVIVGIMVVDLVSQASDPALILTLTYCPRSPFFLIPTDVYYW